ncbi:MAG: ComEC/Rec2 family competence protein [Vampirovibrionales bacterium]|nr:ComEC/Rec2 family competence protein [Vampirovibrionales bacterium]
MALWAAVRNCALSQYSHALIPALFAFALGALIANAYPGGAVFHPAAVAIALLIWLGVIALRGGPWTTRGALWILALTLGGAYAYARLAIEAPYDVSRFAPAPRAWIQGVVENREPARARATLRVLTVNGLHAQGRVQVKTSRETFPPYGSVVLAHGDVVRPWSAWFPGGYDQRRQLLQSNVSAVMIRVDELRVMRRQPLTRADAALRWLEAVRDQILQTFHRALPQREAETLGGIVLGSHASGIDAQTRQEFVNTGLIHLLAASGMNVGVIAACLLGLARWLRWPARVSLPLAMLGVALYMALAGMAASVVRAGVMLLMALGLKLADRTLSALMLLALAVAAMTLWNPLITENIGFQLSVLSTLGLITMTPPLQARLSRYAPRWMVVALLAPVIAQAWVTPVSIFYFNQAPLHAIALNIAAAALVVPLTAMGFIAALGALIWPPLGQVIAWASAPLIHALLWIVAFGNQFNPWALLTPASPPLWLLIALYAALTGLAVALAFGVRLRSTRVALVSTGVAILLLTPFALARWQSRDTSRLDWIPLSETSAALLAFPPGAAPPWLILPQPLRAREGRTLADYLQKQGVWRLAAVVTPPPEGAIGVAGLKAALGKRRVDGVLTQALHATPKPLLTLRDAPFGLRATSHGWRLQIGAGCFEIAAEASLECPAGARVTPGSSPHLWLAAERKALTPGRWHRLEISGRQALIY